MVLWDNTSRAGLGVTAMRRACGDLRAPAPASILWKRRGASSIEVHVRGDTGDDLTIVSAADAKYFERLSNFIGSVHFWEPFFILIFMTSGWLLNNLHMYKSGTAHHYSKRRIRIYRW